MPTNECEKTDFCKEEVNNGQAGVAAPIGGLNQGGSGWGCRADDQEWRGSLAWSRVETGGLRRSSAVIGRQNFLLN